MRIILKYFAPLLAFCVAIFQFTYWQGKPFSKWKCGGFGMYTEPHPNARSIWITAESPSKKARMRLSPTHDDLDAITSKFTLEQNRNYEIFKKHIQKFSTVPTNSKEQKIIKMAQIIFQGEPFVKNARLSILEQSIEKKTNTWTSTFIYGNKSYK